jgi:hypothetical protein
MKLIIKEEHFKLLIEAYNEDLINSYLDRYDELSDEEKDELIRLSKGEEIHEPDNEVPNKELKGNSSYNDGYDDDEDFEDTLEDNETEKFNKADIFLSFFKKKINYPIDDLVWTIERNGHFTGDYLIIQNEKITIIYADPFPDNESLIKFDSEAGYSLPYKITREITNIDEMKEFVGYFIKKIIPEAIKKLT